MHKHFIHNKSAFRKLFLVISILLAYLCFAQAQEADSLYVNDSFYTAEKDGENYFDEISTEDFRSLEKRTIADSVVKKLRADKDFWYANEVPERKAPPPSFHIAEWVQALIRFVIIISFIAILIWFLVASDVRLFRKSSSVFSSADEGALANDIFSIDFENEMEQAKAAGNYRLLVRLMYLQVLRMMAEKNIIQYKAEKTNSDYLVQLGNTSYYKDFFRLTRDFEYAWYGKFDISGAVFDRIQQDFLTLKGRLHP